MADKIKDLLKVNLQFFADGDGAEGGSDGAEGATSDGDGADGDGDSKGETIKLTAEELAKKIESESDKKINKVLEKKMKEWETDYNEKLKNAKEEGERLAKLSAKERQEEEFQSKFEILTKREQELLKKELKAQTISDLHEKKLPPHFADFLMSENAEKTLANINRFKEDYDNSISKAVEDRLKGKSPSTGTDSTGAKPSGVKNQSDFMEMQTKNRIVGK